MRRSFLLLLLSSGFCFLSCKGTLENNPNEPVLENHSNCIVHILKEDAAYGKQRNHACETISLSETIAQYTEQLRSLDYTDCPEDFSKAFQDHSAAWDSVIPITNKYPHLRGEMHVLFDSIEKMPDATEFKRRLDKVWSTWAAVETAQKKYTKEEVTNPD